MDTHFKLILFSLFFYLLSFIAFACSDEDNQMSRPLAGIKIPIDTIRSTGLPIVYINTQGKEPILNRDTWLPALCTIEVPDGNISSQISNYECHVKGRGNLTWSFNKKPFNLKFEAKQKVLGMPKHKRWVFLANYLDRTLMRNSLTMEFGQHCDALEWTPQGRHVDVVFNGEYIGNYWLCEKIGVDKNRLAIDEIDSTMVTADQISGGYLLQIDNNYDETNKFLSRQLLLPFEIISPDDDDCRPEHREYIENFINHLELLLICNQFDEVFEQYLDAKSFADYLIIQLVSGNKDFTKPRSVYFYKKRNGKLYAGPLWDFDLSTYAKEEIDTDQALSVWYPRLLQSVFFRQTLKEQWQQIRPSIEEIAHRHITDKSIELEKSEALNNLVWAIPFSNKQIAYNQDEGLSFAMACKKLELTVQARIDNLSKWIDGL